MWQGYQYCAFSWAMFAFASLFVVARLYVQFRLHIHRWRETFVIIAWLLYLASSITLSLENDWNTFNPEYSAPKGYTDAQVDALFNPVNKVIFAEALFYKPSIYACKAALLLFFADVSPKDIYRKTWWSIRITWVLVIIGVLMQILMNIFDCWPFHLNWSQTHGECGYRMELFVTSWSIHLITDIMVYAIPFVILHNLQNLSAKQRRGAAIMFAVGGLNVVCALIIVVYYALPYSWYGVDALVNFMLCFQQSTAVIIVCMPQIRRLYQLVFSERRRERELKNMPSDRRYGYGTGRDTDIEATGCYNATCASKTINGTVVVGDGNESDSEKSEIQVEEGQVRVTREVRVERTRSI